VTIFVFRDGRLVEKRPAGNDRSSSLPTPYVSRMEPFESPVTGKEVFSHREREADMRAAGAMHPSDANHKLIEKRKRDRARPDSAPIEWGRLDRA
jgi:hypothetical protein